MDFPGNEVGDTEMRILWNKNDITGYISSVTWGGSAKQAARSVTFSVAYSPNDKKVKVLNIKTRLLFIRDTRRIKKSSLKEL